jgi:hypothetical protein
VEFLSEPEKTCWEIFTGERVIGKISGEIQWAIFQDTTPLELHWNSGSSFIHKYLWCEGFEKKISEKKMIYKYVLGDCTKCCLSKFPKYYSGSSFFPKSSVNVLNLF